MNNIIQKHNTPRAVFLYVLNILTFYLSVIGFITLYLQYVSVLFPDQLNFYYTGAANAVRTFTSIIVIAVPVFILTSWLLGRDLKSNVQKRESKLRKWLTYLTLFISAVTIIVDLIMLVNSFLSGELTIRFSLKVIIVLFVAAGVFGYYIWDLRRKDQEASKIPKILAWALGLLVIVSVVVGFLVVGTPAQQRARLFDERRVGDLQMLQSQIVNYWIQKEALPPDLDSLKDSISGFTAPKDPESDAAYEYRILGPLSFELCASFKTSIKNFNVSGKNSRYFSVVPMYYDTYQQNWDHEAGRTCFERTIDPELYKPKQIPVSVLD